MATARLLRSAFLATAIIPTIASAQTPAFSRADIETGVSAYQRLVAGDFNRDGRPDLIVVSHSLAENYGIYLMIGRGDGTFDSPVRVLAPSTGSSLGAADVNGDGTLDLVFLSFGVWTLPGVGDGTFGPAIVSPSTAFSAYKPLFVDVNRDGRLDLVLADQSDGVSVSLGRGDGQFDAPLMLPIGGRVGSVAAGDLDGDGNVDLLAGNMGQPEAFDGSLVTILFGHGDGTFGRRADVSVGTTPLSIAAFDANGDGALDIAASSYATPVLSIAINQGGSFLPASNYAAAEPYTAETVAADFNGDGRSDIAVCGGVNFLSVFTNAGGTFVQRTDIPAPPSCYSAVVADFNLDGRPDLALNYFAGSGTVSIFLNTTTAVIDAQPPAITASADPSVLWPANGRTIPVTVSGTITDDVSGVDPSTLTFVVTDEYGLVQPSGTFAIDPAGRYSFTVMLTASRRGDDKDGRSYRIAISAADRAGNQASAVTVVLVPHDARTLRAR